MIKRPCVVCGKDIKCYKSTYNKKIYCCDKCRKSVTHLEKECIFCGKKYAVAKSRYYSKPNIKYKCCSEKCRIVYHEKEKEKKKKKNSHICTNCSKNFVSPRYNKTNLVFCSQECSKEYMKGIRSPFFSGGTITTQGYKSIKIGNKYILEHRLIMEEYLGRKLSKDEDIHHKDFDRLNNDIENLLVISKSDHTRLHTKIRYQK